ncbi:MAG: hypothetical protein R3Y50_11150, partial [Rikenellaceae bacterium]
GDPKAPILHEQPLSQSLWQGLFLYLKGFWVTLYLGAVNLVRLQTLDPTSLLSSHQFKFLTTGFENEPKI